MSKLHYLSVKPEVPADSYWGHAFIKDVFSQIDLSKSDREVFVIPGAYQYDAIHLINVEINRYSKVMIIITSDEECKFNFTKLQHSDMIVYSQYGNGGYMWPLGYTHETKKHLVNVSKDNGWFFSGQNTHPRRNMLVNELKRLNNGIVNATDGFAKGMTQEEYIHTMCRSKFVFCPPGAISKDTFRFYEALESGCVPIVDDIPPLKSSSDFYWQRMFSPIVFPIYSDMSKIAQILNYPYDNNFVFSWWINWKYQFREKIKSQLNIKSSDTAVIITTSPIKSHPSTKIIEETINSVRVHLPTAPILILVDGVREEQQSMWPQYHEYIYNLLWKCNTEYKDVMPILFTKQVHQSGMLKVMMDNIKTEKFPYLLLLEHDTPITPDREIPFEYLKTKISDGSTNLIRFHFEAFIPEPHKHLMFDVPKDKLQATSQWSQRPHLASTEYYKMILKEYFSNDSNTYIEDRMYGVLVEDSKFGKWDKHRVTIYHPEGDIKRSYHTDGREGERKFDDKLVY